MADDVKPATVIRPAVTEDLPQLLEVLWAVAAEGRWIGTEVPFDRGARQASLAGLIESDTSLLLVADAGGRDGPVGDLSLTVASYGVANLGMLLLDGWRGRGIGAALLAAGISWAREAGAHKVALEVWPDNEPAIALYRRVGFMEEGRKRRHYRRHNGELWDSVLMGLPLA